MDLTTAPLTPGSRVRIKKSEELATVTSVGDCHYCRARGDDPSTCIEVRIDGWKMTNNFQRGELEGPIEE